MSEVNDFTLSQDLKTIQELCESRVMVKTRHHNFTLEEFIDYEKLILKWPHHNRCFNCICTKKKIGIDNLNFNSLPIDKTLSYLEYVANMMYLFENDKKTRIDPLNLKISNAIIYTTA